MDLNLTGKRALVCGSTQGIGRATVEELAAMGASITLLARREEKLKEIRDNLIKTSSAKHHYLVADFDHPEEVQSVIGAYAKEEGIDILVNNTGGPPAGTAFDAPLNAYASAFANHLLCNQALVQAVVPAMKKTGFGRIINIISISVRMPIKGLGVSNTIRGAVANWAKTLSMELGPFGITVNNVLPGYCMTARLESLLRQRAEASGKTFEEIKESLKSEIPAGRISEPHEIAVAVAFLASPAASYINGINIPVDGGRLGCY